MRVKICGMTNPADGCAAAGCGADFIGLIFADSPRRVEVSTARQIVATLPAHTQPVLLFRDAPLDEVCAVLADLRVDWVQLHGAEPLAYVEALRRRMPHVRVIKVWEAADDAAREALFGYAAAAAGPGSEGSRVTRLISAYILDVPKGGAHPGFSFQGELSKGWQAEWGELWLAGGLTPQNVREALHLGRFDGVDVARGVEAAPGVKDHAAIRDFVRQAREP